ncbi:MAG: FAD-dependent oxidoreductase [Proteobacteria bacterium]|nr:FAD-dependent oxidoreductase [Pseudomonadota bacterium]
MPKKVKEETKKPRIAVIGAGINGVIAASSLPHDIIDVDVFEKRKKVGGNVRTLKLKIPVIDADGNKTIKTVCIDVGAEYIAPNYPLVLRGFEITGKEDELSPFELSIHLSNYDANKDIVAPPVLATSNGKEADAKEASSSCFPLATLFGASKKQPQLRFNIKEFFKDLSAFIDLDAFIKRAQEAQFTGNETTPTLEEFVNSWAKNNQKKLQFANDFLYPLIAGGWGKSLDDIKKYKAHFALAYLTIGNKWYEATKGFRSYIDAFKQRYDDKVNYQFNTTITRIEAVEIDGVKKYKLFTQAGVVVDEEGKAKIYDQVIAATPSFVTKDLFADIEDPGVQKRVEAYQQVKSFPMDVVIHTDDRPIFDSSEGAMVRTVCENGISTMSMKKAWKFDDSEQFVYKSWVPPELPHDDKRRPDPNKVMKTFSYRHYDMGIEYEQAYQATQAFQGQGGIYSAMPESDSQNSSIAAGLAIAEQICTLYGVPKTELLEQFDLSKPFVSPVKELLPPRKVRTLHPDTEVIDVEPESKAPRQFARVATTSSSAPGIDYISHPNIRLAGLGGGQHKELQKKHREDLDDLFTAKAPMAAPSNAREAELETSSLGI